MGLTIIFVLLVFTIANLVFYLSGTNEPSKTEERKSKIVKRDVNELSENAIKLFKLHADLKNVFQPVLPLLLPNIPPEVMDGADSFQILNYIRTTKPAKLQRQNGADFLNDEVIDTPIEETINIPDFMTDSYVSNMWLAKEGLTSLKSMIISTQKQLMEHPDYDQGLVDIITEKLDKFVGITDKNGRSILSFIEIFKLVEYYAKNYSKVK